MEGPLKTPDQLKYNRLDEWVSVEASIATIGITDYAQDQLSDVVYVDIKVSPGDGIEQGKLIAVVESVKASSDITAPLSGKVLEINEQLGSAPELINAEPYDRAWILKVEMDHLVELDTLLDANAYREYRSV